MRYVQTLMAFLTVIAASAVYPAVLYDNPVLALGDLFPGDVAMAVALLIFVMMFMAPAVAVFEAGKKSVEIQRVSNPFLGEAPPALTGMAPAVRLSGFLPSPSFVRQDASRDVPAMLGYPTPAE